MAQRAKRPAETSPLDVPARLEELRAIQHGWLDGHGTAPSREGLDWLSRAFRKHYPSDLPLPHTFPTEDGGVEMEWEVGAHAVILEIDLGARTGDWLEFTRGDGEEARERSLNLGAAADWDWLAGELRRLVGPAR